MRVPGIAADVVDVLIVRVAEREAEQQQDGDDQESTYHHVL